MFQAEGRGIALDEAVESLEELSDSALLESYGLYTTSVLNDSDTAATFTGPLAWWPTIILPREMANSAAKFTTRPSLVGFPEGRTNKRGLDFVVQFSVCGERAARAYRSGVSSG